ncbi:zinc finger matrin-type protein 5 isoform X1 [Calonectris borealis]|uniref:zinc finger matrin-type protein 5 isoform X1 n=1 Tax=Calonectris borealis TaxID=1323832 RepID=UPI003F4C718E
MGKRYFCDYCDRSFQDNLHNRKKHLNGVQHLRAKRVWYDLFRDAAAILQEEQTKKPCRKFLQTGQCDFGSNCRFSHMTEQDLEKLSAQVQGEQRLKELRQEGADVPPGTIEDWLEKRAKRLSAAQSNRHLPDEATAAAASRGKSKNDCSRLSRGRLEDGGEACAGCFTVSHQNTLQFLTRVWRRASISPQLPSLLRVLRSRCVLEHCWEGSSSGRCLPNAHKLRGFETAPQNQLKFGRETRLPLSGLEQQAAPWASCKTEL